jgi:penicillin-binding protein 1A
MKRLFRFVFKFGVILGLLSTIAVVIAGIHFYIKLTRDLPQIQRISDYQPKAVTTLVSKNGIPIAEVYDERRYPVPLDEIPEVVRNAFLAAEDANFYSHPGIDIVSIARAFWVNLQAGGSRQGASTITQQIVKSLLLSREKTYTRKAKEAILSYRLEKALTKDEILVIYLNEIFLGSRAYGIVAAAKVHFHKTLSELTVAEAAWLAGLPKKPSYYAAPRNRDEALERQRYVLKQMLENKFIDKEQYATALEQQLEIFDAEDQTILAAPYFASHAIHELKELFRKKIGKGVEPGNPGGYIVETTVDLKAYDAAERAVQENLRNLDKRQGWRGAFRKAAEAKTNSLDPYFAKFKKPSDIAEREIYRARVDKVSRAGKLLNVSIGDVKGRVSLAKASWAKRMLNSKNKVYWSKPERELAVGDIIEVSLAEKPRVAEVVKEETPKGSGEENSEGSNERVSKEKKAHKPLKLRLDQTPLAQSAMVVSSAITGDVVALIGGYDYSQSQFNRATQGRLQPGSAFKPFIYLAAIEDLQYTPATIVPDSPISMVAGDGKLWAPQNYDHTFLGPITLRTALQRSRNVVSVYLLQRIGVGRGIQSARRLGISTEIPPNMSISLGTAEIHPIELVRAYGAFAAEGWLADTVVIRKVKDRYGKVLFEKRTKQEPVIDPTDAFLMANMMKGVVERGTAQRVKELGRPVAGKTGTTNDQMDAWFVGYTPEWVAGVWVGFDQKRSLGRFETGGKAAAPAFLAFMQEFLDGTTVFDFNIPDGVIPISINLATGQLADPDDPSAFVEYFKSGTEPRRTSRQLEIPRDYLTNDEF